MTSAFERALVLVLLLAAGCGRGSARRATAEAALRAGDFDAAEEVLRGDAGAGADELRAQLAKLRASRSDIELRLARIERELGPSEASTALQELARHALDSVTRERVERALRSADERRAQRPVVGARSETAVPDHGVAPPAVVSEGAGAAAVVDVAGDARTRTDEHDESERVESERARAASGARSFELANPALSSASADESLAARAEASAARGELAAAAELLLDAARHEPPGAGRDALLARARAQRSRAALRSEIAAARERDLQVFEELGIGAVQPAQLVYLGSPIAWQELPLDVLKRAAGRARLSQEAELGLLVERVFRGEAEGPSGGLAEAHDLLSRGLLGETEAWWLVAESRGEPIPEDGYVYGEGGWITTDEHERAARAAELQTLDRRLAEAGPGERQKAFEALLELGTEALPAIEQAFAARAGAAQRELSRGTVLDQLERVAEQRRELDARRAAALELIFDEERYFYPYRPPEVEQEKAKLYPAVQARVDELVSAVHEPWDRPRKARLGAGFRAALEELDWLRERALEAEVPFAEPADLPEWLAAVDPGLDTVALADFAWTAKERADLARHRAVRARNERLWEAGSERGAGRAASASEAAQVRVTNDYRALLGRGALAWNPRIQEAARMHAVYMADSGDFGHFEPDPERRAPGDRMRLAGYSHGISENCHMGGGGAEEAHVGWTHSSGHHRNLLEAAHTEMASAAASNYWVQDFGVDHAFESELSGASDAR